jgi:hypothetical protein
MPQTQAELQSLLPARFEDDRNICSRRLRGERRRHVARRDDHGHPTANQVARGSRAEQELGGFYVIDFRHNSIVAKDVALRALGRKLGALRSYEYLVED